jgi:hypothetical protein
LNQNVFEFIEVLWVELDSTEQRTDSLFRASFRKLDSDKFFYYWLFDSGFIDDWLFDSGFIDDWRDWRFNGRFDDSLNGRFNLLDRRICWSFALLLPEKETGHD